MEMVSSNKCKMPNTKRVSFNPAARNVFYADTLNAEERSSLWCTSEDLELYETDFIESIHVYRAYLDGKISSPDETEYCARGLEAYLETNILTKASEHYVDCILELQDDLFDVEEGDSGMDPERREKLICAIEKLNEREGARAFKRAAKDRSAADQMHNEDRETLRQSPTTSTIKAKINRRTTRLSFSKAPQPRIQCAATA